MKKKNEIRSCLDITPHRVEIGKTKRALVDCQDKNILLLLVRRLPFNVVGLILDQRKKRVVDVTHTRG